MDVKADTPSTTSWQELDQGPEQDGDAAALWSYLQPHLVKHKGADIPTQGWVPQLLTLPQVRDLDWNTPWLATHPYNDTNPRDISCLIIQATGEPAPKPCERCSHGKGPFRSCIMISSKAKNGPLGAIFACANCFYHFGQTNCTHKHWGADRASRILKLRGEGGPLDEALDEIRDEEPSDDGSVEHEDTNAVDDDNMEYTMDDSNAGTPLLTSGDVPAGITEAEPGRPYTMWPGESDSRAA